ncbi:cupin domain-containing protein [Deinococcus sp.]|uniref:cupin domain-containing protein n=1 Tax=Deinococcus sp. TaxID=47478 RepID=UPI003B58BF46
MPIYKVSQNESQHGKDGQHHLIAGDSASMRLWHNEKPSDSADKEAHANGYETLGYIISGRAELTVDGETFTLMPGDSYRVPKNAQHVYKILETLTAVETTTPASF